MKASFDAPQHPVKVIEDGNKVYAFIAVNGEWTERQYADDMAPQKCWECDYREIVTARGKIDLDALKASPENYLDWVEPEADDPLTDIQLALAELYEMIGG